MELYINLPLLDFKYILLTFFCLVYLYSFLESCAYFYGKLEYKNPDEFEVLACVLLSLVRFFSMPLIIIFRVFWLVGKFSNKVFNFS